MESPATVLHQIAARMQRADEPVRAATGKTQPLADFRDRKTVRFCGEKLEDVERAVRRLDRLRLRLTEFCALRH